VALLQGQQVSGRMVGTQVQTTHGLETNHSGVLVVGVRWRLTIPPSRRNLRRESFIAMDQPRHSRSARRWLRCSRRRISNQLAINIRTRFRRMASTNTFNEVSTGSTRSRRSHPADAAVAVRRPLGNTAAKLNALVRYRDPPVRPRRPVATRKTPGRSD